MNIKKVLTLIVAFALCITLLTACDNEEERQRVAYAYGLEDSPYDLTEALTTDSLKELCADYFMLGVGLTGNATSTGAVNSLEYMTVAKYHFNSVTLTNLMKPTFILDKDGCVKYAEKGKEEAVAVQFSSVDPTLQWCLDNGVQMRGHTLVWHAQTPDWFFRVGYDSEADYVDYDTMLARLDSYIEQVLTYIQDKYPGVIYAWDVVNEAVDPGSAAPGSYFACRTWHDGGANGWYKTLGEDYVELAFKSARKYADEDVKLFYNDFNTFQGGKHENIINLCKHLNELGLIDGIGMQGYWGIDWPNVNDVENAIKNFAELGLELHVTELSIGVDNLSDKNLEIQAKKYEEYFKMFQRLDTAGGGPANITSVTLFGLQDGFVMYNSDDTTTRLFDTNFKPKPCFYRVQEVMEDLYYVVK
ncbi:MAG: endo-1,4-beta-xylanase [Oscillospiraceae bacterium]|nr:endo-1,4-beta-xylanase [Oscillospiraceae bacterium]